MMSGQSRPRQVDEVDWKLHRGKHETPCHFQQVRVKIVEPGPQNRKCAICGEVNVFVLEPMQMFPDRLRLRWLDDVEVAELNEVEGDLAIEDL